MDELKAEELRKALVFKHQNKDLEFINATNVAEVTGGD
jgi:hypothetical protein